MIRWLLSRWFAREDHGLTQEAHRFGCVLRYPATTDEPMYDPALARRAAERAKRCSATGKPYWRPRSPKRGAAVVDIRQRRKQG